MADRLAARLDIDDFMGGITITGNTFYRLIEGIVTNKGSDFTIHNNLWFNVGTPVRAGAEEIDRS